jgi:hypothetical protein
MKEATTRDDLIKCRGQMYDLIGSLEGTRPEMTDKQVKLAFARVIWCIIDFLVRKTW